MLKQGLVLRGRRVVAVTMVAVMSGIGGCTYGRELADGVSAGVLNGISILVSNWIAGLSATEE